MRSRFVYRTDVEPMEFILHCLNSLRFLTCALLCCLPLLLSGRSTQEPNDSLTVKIFFKGGKSVYNPDLNNNREVLSEYISRIKALNDEDLLIDVTVKGYVSPDGKEAINERLAVERSRVLADIIEQQAGIDRAKIKTTPVGINWDELRLLVATRPDVPARKAILNILDNTPVWLFDKSGNIIGGRKKSLMDLRGGRPYRWLYSNIFPELRNAVAISLTHKQLPPPIGFNGDDSKSIVCVDVSDSTCQTTADSSSSISSDISDYPDEQSDSDKIPTDLNLSAKCDPLHKLALKTNLLYYPVLLPNLEIEWYVNDKWSLCLEGNVAWWGKYSKNRSYRLAVISPEVRRWFKRGPLRRGFFVGATAGIGIYDFLKDTPGYRGTGYMAGITGGYQWPISRNLSFEGSLGLGFVNTTAKKYVIIDTHHVYNSSKLINYFGPIKLEFSIIWRFLDSYKQKNTERL